MIETIVWAFQSIKSILLCDSVVCSREQMKCKFMKHCVSRLKTKIDVCTELKTCTYCFDLFTKPVLLFVHAWFDLHISDKLCSLLNINMLIMWYSQQYCNSFAIQPAGQLVWLPCFRSLLQMFLQCKSNEKNNKNITFLLTFWLSKEQTLLFILYQIHICITSVSVRLSPTWCVLVLHLFPTPPVLPLILLILFFFPPSASVEGLQTDITDDESKFTVKTVCLKCVYTCVCACVILSVCFCQE